jgi:hypothetical protein
MAIGTLLRRAVLVASALACAPPLASAADPEPAGHENEAENTKLQCLVQHEEAQVARAHRRLLEARTALRLCSRAVCPGALRSDCIEWLDQVSRSLPSVVVTARARGADETEVKVFVDGKLATERLTGGALEVDPGEHTFRFESPPWPAVERTILVSEGIKDRPLDVDFAPVAPLAPSPAPAIAQGPLPPPQPPPERPLRRIDYALAGAALAALASATYFASWALIQRNNLLHDCAPFCTPEQRDSVHTKLVAADVSLGVSALSLAAFYLGIRGVF